MQMTQGVFTQIYGPPPEKVNYPGQKGDPAPNARFQNARNRYNEVMAECEKVVALIEADGSVQSGNRPNSRQMGELSIAAQVCKHIGHSAYVVVRPTTLSRLWLVFGGASMQVRELVNGMFVEPRPCWLPIDPMQGTPRAARVFAESFIADSINRGNAWTLPNDTIIPGEIVKKNEELLKAALGEVEALPGVDELPQILF
jgi:hypothetical protein